MLISALLLLLTTSPIQTTGTAAPHQATGAASADAVPQDEIDAAVLTAARFLIRSQENYVIDPPVGTLPESELEPWQSKEKERLQALRSEAAGEGTEWPYEGVHRVGPDGRIPGGYRIGGSAIVAEGLLAAGLQGEDLANARAAIQRSVSFAMEALDSDPSLARGPKKGYDVRGWGHAYGVRLLLLAIEHGLVDGEAEADAREMIVDLIDRLHANVTTQGGWNYADDKTVSPFMTGTTLLILRDAEAAGFEVDEAMVEKALAALELSCTKAMSYSYSGEARKRVAMPSSAARSSVATLALYKAGRRSQDDLRLAVQGFFDGWEDLLARKSKQGTHKRPYGIAPYYFFYGHTYAALAIEELPEEERPARRASLVSLLWKTRDDGGTWNDRVFPRTASYSTAMAILALTAPKH